MSARDAASAGAEAARLPGRAGRVVQVSVSGGGVPKRAVPGAWVRAPGVEGDRQAHPRFHGGPLRAVCLYTQEAIERLRAEGHSITAGATGENMTLAGVDLGGLASGDRLALGSEEAIAREVACVLELTTFARPCTQIAACFRDGDSSRMSEAPDPSLARRYAKVVREGFVAAGDVAMVLAPVRVTPATVVNGGGSRPSPQPSVPKDVA